MERALTCPSKIAWNSPNITKNLLLFLSHAIVWLMHVVIIHTSLSFMQLIYYQGVRFVHNRNNSGCSFWSSVG